MPFGIPYRLIWIFSHQGTAGVTIAQFVAEQSVLVLTKAVHRVSPDISSDLAWGSASRWICSFEAKAWVCLLTILEQVDVIR